MVNLEELAKEVAQLRKDFVAQKQPLLLTKKAAATLLGIDRNTTLQQLIEDGRICTVRIGKRDRISLREIERILLGVTRVAKKIKREEKTLRLVAATEAAKVRAAHV